MPKVKIDEAKAIGAIQEAKIMLDNGWEPDDRDREEIREMFHPHSPELSFSIPRAERARMNDEIRRIMGGAYATRK
jgi:hypothetical protein